MEGGKDGAVGTSRKTTFTVEFANAAAGRGGIMVAASEAEAYLVPIDELGAAALNLRNRMTLNSGESYIV
jgi:hypothetical protein